MLLHHTAVSAVSNSSAPTAEWGFSGRALPLQEPAQGHISYPVCDSGACSAAGQPACWQKVAVHFTPLLATRDSRRTLSFIPVNVRGTCRRLLKLLTSVSLYTAHWWFCVCSCNSTICLVTSWGETHQGLLVLGSSWLLSVCFTNTCVTFKPAKAKLALLKEQLSSSPGLVLQWPPALFWTVGAFVLTHTSLLIVFFVDY